MFTKLQKLFSPKVQEVVIDKGWRRGMWVVHNDQVGILNKVGEIAEVHHVNKETGETTLVVNYPLVSLRQAKYHEIPACRMHLSKQQAEELGYAS